MFPFFEVGHISFIMGFKMQHLKSIFKFIFSGDELKGYRQHIRIITTYLRPDKPQQLEDWIRVFTEEPFHNLPDEVRNVCADKVVTASMMHHKQMLPPNDKNESAKANFLSGQDSTMSHGQIPKDHSYYYRSKVSPKFTTATTLPTTVASKYFSPSNDRETNHLKTPPTNTKATKESSGDVTMLHSDKIVISWVGKGEGVNGHKNLRFKRY